MRDGYLSLKLKNNWRAEEYSRHLLSLTILYRWIVISDILDEYPNIFKENEQIFAYLSGKNIKSSVVHQLDFFEKELHSTILNDLSIHSISYGSPTDETFRGYVDGLNGIAGLIERMIFWRTTKEMKDVELEERKLALIERKISAIEKVEKYMKSKNMGRKNIEKLKEIYTMNIDDLLGLVDSEKLKTVSLASELYVSDDAETRRLDVAQHDAEEHDVDEEAAKSAAHNYKQK